MRRRASSGGLALVLLTGALVAAGVAQPAAACACGAPAPPDGVRVTVGQEQALVSYADGVERIDLVLDMLADGAETGLVLPTPTPATVSRGDPALFEALDRQTEPEVVVRQDWWGAMGDGGAGGAPPTVLSEVDLGPVQAVTLAASDTDGLREWLDANGYGIAPGVQALLGDYVSRGWSFAALKLTGEQTLDGQLDPVRFEFTTEAPVYPPAALPGVGGSAERAPLPPGRRPHGGGVPRWCGAARGRHMGEVPSTKSELMPLGAYLTVVDAYFFDPATQITGDLDIRSTGERRDYAPVTERTEYPQLGGLPLGYIIVGLGGLLAAMLAFLAITSIRVRRS